MFNKKETSLLEKAYKKQSEVEMLRVEQNAAIKAFEHSKKEFAEIVGEIRASGIIKTDEYELLTKEIRKDRKINKDFFNKFFGEEKTIEACTISVKGAEAAVGKNQLEAAEGVIEFVPVLQDVVEKR